MSPRLISRLLSTSAYGSDFCVCGLIQCIPAQCPSLHYNKWPVLSSNQDLAPYMGSSWDIIDTALNLIEDDYDKKSLLDLGCGDGRILIRALQRGISYAEGWELNQSVYELAKSHVTLALPNFTQLELKRRYDIIHGDLRKSHPWKFDIITMFLIPSGLSIVEKWLLDHMVSSCSDDYKTVYVITIGWQFSSLKTLSTAQSESGTMIYKYQIDLKFPRT